MSQQRVEITCVLDKSGSMHNQINDTIGGYNGFINKQSTVENAHVSLITFSTHVKTEYNSLPVKDVPHLTEDNYQPAGGTALLDAIGTAIKYNDTLDETTKKMVVIITDGEENSSKKYTKAHINDLITDRRSKDWEFVFLAANQDAILTGESYGIAPEAALSFNQQDATQEAFDAVSCAVHRSATSKDANVAFTTVQRQKSMGCQPRTVTSPPPVSRTQTTPPDLSAQSYHDVWNSVQTLVSPVGGFPLDLSSPPQHERFPPRLTRQTNRNS